MQVSLPLKVYFNIRKLRAKYPNLKYIIVSALSYNNISFEDMQKALVGIEDGGLDQMELIHRE